LINHLELKTLEPEQRLLMGPGPVNVYPAVLRALSLPMLGQFDPQFIRYMDEVMALYRQVYRTRNQWTFLVNGSARAGIEACLSSMISPGDRVLVPIFGRFGHLLTEIARRCQAEVINIETEWGTVFKPEQIADAIRTHQPRFVALVHGDTSTTMAQPLDEIGPLCREAGTVVYVDATATLGGMPIEVDKWCLDAVSAGLQKCLSGPPGSSPLTINDRVAEIVNARKHVEVGIRPEDFSDADGLIVQSNYFDLAMLMDYWSSKRLNHHTEATSMLYAAHTCAQEVLREGLEAGFARHRISSQALRAGLTAMNLKLFGDERYRMDNVTGVFIPNALGDGEQVRTQLLDDFGLEIGTSFGPLRGKVWRIGTMGYVCHKANILRCLSSLEIVMRRNGFVAPPGAGVDAAYKVYNQ
jgi:(S)-ureidoglycine-glyoxylate aminotransferase